MWFGVNLLHACGELRPYGEELAGGALIHSCCFPLNRCCLLFALPRLLSNPILQRETTAVWKLVPVRGTQQRDSLKINAVEKWSFYSGHCRLVGMDVVLDSPATVIKCLRLCKHLLVKSVMFFESLKDLGVKKIVTSSKS